ncbi:MAG: tetratricopeptide repeat protein [Gammaproteobacteria bacterium]
MHKTIATVSVSLALVWSGGQAVAQETSLSDSAAISTTAVEAKMKARASYEAFLRLANLDDPRRPGALRRLADMELERAEELLIIGEQDAEALVLYGQAIALYQDLLDQYPGHDGNDAVFYQLARAQEAVGDMDAARTTLAQLVQEQPTSSFAEESEFRRGETLFSQGNYEAAALAYADVIKRAAKGGGTFLEQSWYKHGWSLFKLSDYPESQSAFLNLLRHRLLEDGEYKRDAMKELPPGSQEMLLDALRAMSLSFAYGEGVADLNALLDRDTAPGFEHLLFTDLGELARKEERYQDAAEAYRAFVARLPNARHAPHMQLAVIETYRDAGFFDQELAAKEEFATEYALNAGGDDYWSLHSPEESGDVVVALKLNLTELTQYYHAAAQERKSRPRSSERAEAYSKAEQWYRAWLSSFPDVEESPETHFLLAELLFDQGEFAKAVTAYEFTAYEYEPHARASEAAYAALLAYGKHEAAIDDPQTRWNWERQSIDSALKFASAFKDHAEATRVQTDATERLYERGDLDDALQAAKDLLAWEPQAPLSEQRIASLVAGNTYFDQKNYAEAESAFAQTLALEVEGADGAATRNDVTELLAASVYRQGEAEQAAGGFDKAADHFLRLAKVAPASKLIPTAEYEAASVLMDLKDYGRAAQVLQGFRDNFPGHELQRDVTRNLSVSYLESGDTANAAGELMRLARDPLNDSETRLSANYQAIDIFREADDTNNLLDSYVYLIDSQTLPLDDHIDAREQVASIYQEMGSESQYIEWVRSIISTDAQAGSAATPRSRTAAARATLMFAKQQWGPFAEVRLQEPLQQNLRLKKQRMETLLDQLGQASRYNIAEVTTAATYQIAAAYAEMADSLMTSERPGGLNADELEQYEFLLEEQAFPFEEQAIEIHETNVNRLDDGLYDAWMRQSFAALAQLMPGRYQKVEKGVSVAELND